MSEAQAVAESSAAEPSQAESSESSASEISKEPTPSEKRSFKLKVEGREEELDEDSVIKFAQLGRAANKRFEEAARLRKEAEEKESKWKDPKNFLKDLGPEARKAAEEFLAEQLRQEMLSPEEKEREDLKKENARLKETDKQRQEREEQDRLVQATARAAQEYDVSMSKALESTGLPKTASSVKRMASYMYQAASNGYDMSADEAASLVQEDYMNDIREILDTIPDPSKFLSEKVAEKLMEQRLSKVKGAKLQPTPKEPNTPKTKNVSESWLSPEEFRRSVRGY